MANLNSLKKIVAILRKRALAYPETTENFPWGHSAFKVKGKSFLFTYLDEKDKFLSMSMKLPLSGNLALSFAFARATEYGLGKHGWVTSIFKADDDVPVEILLEWMDESFRAVAPTRVLALMEEDAVPSPPPKPKRKKKV
jgi:predicted DNA-binding protein (MmcQ/YjbR family)